MINLNVKSAITSAQKKNQYEFENPVVLHFGWV